MEGLVNTYRDANITPEEIAESIADFSDITRSGIYASALLSRDRETADKINKANQIIKERKINEFKSAVANGTEKEFLSTMSWLEKVYLEIDIELTRMGKQLTEEEQRYLDILEESINKDIEREALSQ